MIATVIFSIGAISCPWILFDRYNNARKAIRNTSAPCYDNPHPSNFDDCIKKGVPMADRFRNAVKEQFGKALFGPLAKDGQDDDKIKAKSLFYKNCLTTDTTQDPNVHKLVIKEGTGADEKDICFGAWAFPKTILGAKTDGTVVTCTASDPLTDIDFDLSRDVSDLDDELCKSGAATGSLANCGVECTTTGTGTAAVTKVTKINGAYFLKKMTLGGATYDEKLTDYIDDHLQPMPFDEFDHADPYYAVQNLYRNMREFSIVGNLTLGEVTNLERQNGAVRQLVSDLSLASQSYYLFLNTRIYVLAFAILATVGPVLIALSEFPKLKDMPFFNSSLFHWAYSACYFLSVFLAIVFFGIVVSTDYHMNMVRSLDRLMVDTGFGNADDDSLNPTDPNNYRDYMWVDHDQPSLYHRLRVISSWWTATFAFVVLSLTAHLSLKLGPLMGIVRQQVKEFTAASEKKTIEGVTRGSSEAARARAGAKYLPLVSVVRK